MCVCFFSCWLSIVEFYVAYVASGLLFFVHKLKAARLLSRMMKQISHNSHQPFLEQEGVQVEMILAVAERLYFFLLPLLVK